MFRILVLAVAVSLLSASASYAGEWVKLGERQVGFINDHDKIEVGREEGKFKRLRLRVRRNDIELNSINVVFGNGEVEHIKFDERLREGEDSPVINLKTPSNEGRHIREVELHYHSRPDFRGEAVAELWGQEDEASPTPVVYGHDHEWEKLGDRHVGFINDHDTIHVGRHDGKFTRLKLLVRGNSIKLNSIKVYFGNGEVEDLPFDRHIHDGAEAVIDLPHGWKEGRFIRDVELHYHSQLNFRGEAIAELWGQQG